MKKVFLQSIFVCLVLIACSNDTDEELKKVSVTLKFTHNWDGIPVTLSDFNDFKFTNKNGERISIQRLRYLVSNIFIGNSRSGNFALRTEKNYDLIDLTKNKNLEILITNVNEGNYKLGFTFGFSDADNRDGVYQDLNSANFNVPLMLGGGYHYMQFDGKYKDTNNQDANFNYHAIRAVDRTDPKNLQFEDTSFLVDLGNIEIKNNTTIEIKMNIAEWFKNPNTWNLNQLNTVLMPNFNAQKLINANGKTVFSLGTVIP